MTVRSWKSPAGLLLALIVAGCGASSTPSPSTPASGSSSPSASVASESPSESASAEPSESASASPQATTKIYTVKRGDTLTKIATAFHVTVAAIRKANPKLNPNVLKVGQKIIIPVK